MTMRTLLTGLIIAFGAIEASGQVVRVSGRKLLCEGGACRPAFGYGTGFIVHQTEESQWIVTAAHLFDDQSAWVGLGANTMQPCELLHKDDRCDVALLKTRRRFSGGVLPLRAGSVPVGTPVSFVGYGGPEDYIARRLTGKSIDAERLTFRADSGDSGGPAVIEGQCVGVITHTAKDGTYSRMSPCACWRPWLVRFIPLPIPVLVPPHPSEPRVVVQRDPSVAELQRQVAELQAIVEQLKLRPVESGPAGKDASPFTINLRSQSKRDPTKWFDLGTVRVTGPGEYTLDLPDMHVVWMRDGVKLSEQTFPAGTPVFLDVSTIQAAPAASTVPNEE